MTFEQWVLAELEANGMFPAQAQAVLTAYRADPVSTAMDRWHDRVDDYPVAMRAVIWLGVCQSALAWIDANLPRAWYRPMFLSEAERNALFAA